MTENRDANKGTTENKDQPIITFPQWIEPPAEQPEPKVYGPAPPIPAAPELNVYDLVYGILFEPGKTFHQVAENPPVKLTLVLIIGINFLLAIMGMFTTQQGLIPDELMTGRGGAELQAVIDAATPVFALGGFLVNLVAWFILSALLHLISEFFGGKGRALTSFTVYGLAGLPAIFLLPLQGLEIFLPQNPVISTIVGLGALAVFLWGIVLLVIGLREAHKFSTARSVAVVATPWIAGAVVLFVAAILMVGIISALIPQLGL